MAFAKPYLRRCAKCGRLYRTDVPGARWTNPKGNPRYVHPGCELPKRSWTPAP